MIDPYEKFVRWYLRFNGYFSIENFVIHEPVRGGVPQGGEFDILAVRFPFSREVVGFELENDFRLAQREIDQAGLIDFVIAEVGGGGRKKLNRIWEPHDPEGKKAERIVYMLQWAGFFDNDVKLTSIANELQSKHHCRYAQFNLRVIFFGQDTQNGIDRLEIEQITFRQIAEFISKVRTPCYQNRELGVRSAHNQWDPLILDIWKAADPESAGDLNGKVTAILTLLDNASKNLA